jgi:Zinc carboxypeptidase
VDPTPQSAALPGAVPEGILEDRNGDGLPDYLNARIYVPAGATVDEIAAAANVAARLAFETLSLDLPIGACIDDFTETDPTFAIVIGRAALGWCSASAPPTETRQGARRVLAIASPEAADRWAASDLVPGYTETTMSGRGVSDRRARHSLADLFARDRVLIDSDVRLSLGPDVEAPEVIDLAARIALESSHLRLPMAVPWRGGDPGKTPIVLIGRSHPGVRPGAGPGLPGEGRIEMVSSGAPTRLEITGTDADGEARALSLAARSLPYLNGYRKGEIDLTRIEADLHDFVTLRSAAAQLAAGLTRARSMTDFGSPDTRVSISVRGNAPDTPIRVRHTVRPPQLAVHDLGFHASIPVFEEAFTLEWEVDRAQKLMETSVFPEIRRGSAIELDLRLSEPAEIRRTLAVRLTRELTRRGADPVQTKVRVLPAHKQAYSWITETLLGRLQSASTITIEACQNAASGDGSIEAAERWLQELYPVDETLARELGLAPSSISLLLVPVGPTYRVTARDRFGSVVVDEPFEPAWVERPLFSRFPEYATSLVSTGWISARIDGRVRLDERVRTDPECFWDAFEERGLGRLQRYLLDLYGGAPDPALAPHFGTFEVEVEMSEPDERLGIDEERISTLEALHEDIYFMTLLFIQLTGQNSQGCTLPYPGRIVPRVRSGGGAQPSVRLCLTGKSHPAPAVELHAPGESRRVELRPVPEVRPRIHRLTLSPELAGVTLGVRLDQPLGRDTAAVLRTLGDLEPEGHGSPCLCYTGVRQIDIEIDDGASLTRVTLPAAPHPACAPQSPRLPVDPKAGPVPLDTPLDPEEAERQIARLSVRSGVRTFLAGQSFLGRPIWAQEVAAPMDGHYVSQSRLTISRPVLFLTGRQHGNEVSSTSHILRLLEWLVPDTSGRVHPVLNRVSLIILPVTNPDGAGLAAELARESPGFMMHAGYYGCLGEDVTRDLWSEYSPYPETHIRRSLWEMWQPDLVLDAHGYPSHEWVQLFGGYSGWFRSRERIRRDWWIPRGAFQPEPDGPPASPERLRTIQAIRDRIDEAFEARLGAPNLRMRNRYRKYVGAIPDRRPAATRPGFARMAPDITLVEAVIELPDETADGPWLERLIETGLEASQACLEVLADASWEVRRGRMSAGGGTTFFLERRRPLQSGSPSR